MSDEYLDAEERNNVGCNKNMYLFIYCGFVLSSSQFFTVYFLDCEIFYREMNNRWSLMRCLSHVVGIFNGLFLLLLFVYKIFDCVTKCRVGSSGFESTGPQYRW